MSDILISEKQLHYLHSVISNKDDYQLAEENWNKFDDNQKQFVLNVLEAFYPHKSIIIREAQWYNTVMDILGIVDPTPVVDIINATSYFMQGDNLYGALTMIGAIPYAGDFVAKPVLGALKIGAKEVKLLESAMKVMKSAAPGSKQYLEAEKMIAKLAKEPGVIGSFLQKMGGSFGDKVLKTIDEIPAGPFKGMKNTIKNYMQLLVNAGKKSKSFQGLSKSLAADFKIGKAGVADVKALKDLLQAQKVFDVATLSKPGFLSQTFFGGLPRLFRSPEQRRLRIMMQSTKWWLGFLDYIGLGNWVGAEEVIKEMGTSKFDKKLNEYQNTPQAKKYFEEQFGTQEAPEVSTQTSSKPKEPERDQIQNFFRNIFMGQINPVPGM